MAASGSISAIVERQMRNWELARTQQPAASAPSRPKVREFVTISRSVGCGGAEAAAALAERIQWPLFGREVLQYMAGDDKVRRRLYETMDERDVSFVEETLRAFTDSEFRTLDYFHRLSETILAIARQGQAVFLGRGADLILPRDIGLRVRFTALPVVCAQRYAAAHGLDVIEATRAIERIERERSKFIRNHFHLDPLSADRFDLILNLTSLTQDQAVQLIENAMRLRGLLA